MLQAATAL